MMWYCDLYCAIEMCDFDIFFWLSCVVVSDYFFFALFVPYTDLPCFLFSTGFVSYTHLTTWYLTPGRSFTLPPLIMTTECSWSVCFSPGIYAITSAPLDNLTFAIFLCAELGFFGLAIVTFRHTPLLKGAESNTFFTDLTLLSENCNAGALDLTFLASLGFLISWLIVGIEKRWKKWKDTKMSCTCM